MAQSRIKRAFNVDLPQHKRARIDDDNKAQGALQVIGAGLPRTGTTSLKAALEILGYDPCHHMSEVIDHPRLSSLFAAVINVPSVHDLSAEESRARHDRIRHATRGYLSSVAWPSCAIYRDLMALHPDAKVILSVRDSDAAWWGSFSATMAVQATARYGLLTYPVPFLRCYRILVRTIYAQWMRLDGIDELGPGVHTAHNADVQAHVPQERLLVFNVKMGWSPLCEFLDVPVPKRPFPRLNDAEAISRFLRGAQYLGFCVWLLYLGSALLSVWAVLSTEPFRSLR